MGLSWRTHYIFWLNGLLLLLISTLLIAATSNFASFDPKNNLTFHFFWVPVLVKITIYIVLFVACFLRRYIVFPATLLFIIPVLYSAIFNVWQAVSELFPYAFENLWGLVVFLEFILAIIGTILWYRNMRYHGGKFWQ